jgi:hypothetical protein
MKVEISTTGLEVRVIIYLMCKLGFEWPLGGILCLNVLAPAKGLHFRCRSHLKIATNTLTYRPTDPTDPLTH